MKIAIEPENATQNPVIDRSPKQVNRLPAAICGIAIVLVAGVSAFVTSRSSIEGSMLSATAEVVIHESGLLPATIEYHGQSELVIHNKLTQTALVQLGTLCTAGNCEQALEADASLTIPLGDLKVDQTFYVVSSKEFTGNIVLP